eukprot:207572-Pelagomonas_calceolata.AAC.5
MPGWAEPEPVEAPTRVLRASMEQQGQQQQQQQQEHQVEEGSKRGWAPGKWKHSHTGATYCLPPANFVHDAYALLLLTPGPTYGLPDARPGQWGAHKLMDVLSADHGKRCCLVGHRDMLARFATGVWVNV